VNARSCLAALGAALLLVACSQKDPANEAIEAAADALNAVYEDAQKYVPDRYAAVKAELDAARKAFDEERYTDAIAAVKDVPAHAEALGKEAAAAKEKHVADQNAEWARLSDTLPDRFTAIGSRLDELGKLKKLPEGMDRQLLDEAKAALASAQSAWEEAGAAYAKGDLDTAVDKGKAAEGTAQDLVARLGMTAS
jgi:hypothetical protein